MNIFATYECPFESAKFLDDKRVVKMVLESAQILSTAIYINNKQYYESNNFLKFTHINHPCVKWAAMSDDNYNWLLQHFVGLLKEYRQRFNRSHKLAEHALAFYQYLIPGKIYPRPVKFMDCTGKYVNSDIINVHDKYKFYLKDKWLNDKSAPRYYKQVINLKRK